jgi:LAO/AO transport system kinase
MGPRKESIYMNLADQILKGNARATAKGISLVEDNEAEAQDLLRAIFPHTGGSTIIGITGSPGSGKSTIVDQLITQVKTEASRIGIIAVDPSSPFTGGAILGDRIRMMRHSQDPDIFIRSMATRGHLGGLAKSTGEAISVLEAAGKQYILIETVGVGQDEVEVVKMADLVLVVLIPGAGDEIQAFKAGIMEIADAFILNKADSPEAFKAERQLKAMLDLGIKDHAIPPVCKTVAITGEGMEDLWATALDLLHKRPESNRAFRKKRLIEWMLRDIISTKVAREVHDRVDETEFQYFIDEIYQRRIDPYVVADGIIERLKGKE